MKRAISDSITRTSNLKPPSSVQVAYFLIGVAVLTTLLDIYIIYEIKTARSMAIIPLMWIPAVVAVACSHYFGNKERDMGFIVPGNRSMIYAYVIPSVCAILMLLILVLIRVGEFKAPQSSWLKVALIQPTLGVIVGFTLAMGQELGWRGYLHTHLMRARVPEPMIVTGLIWSVWHWPLILFADYSTSAVPWFSVLLFTVTMTSFSIILGWLREFSRSVYPCALAYSAHNTWMQTIAPEIYRPGRLDPFFSGESGFVLAIIYLLIAIYLYRYHVAASNY